MDRTCEKALELLKRGAVQPTTTFAHLVPVKGTDVYPEDAQKQRISRLLKRVGKMLDDTGSPWKLVRLTKRGQNGLYQLAKRAKVHKADAGVLTDHAEEEIPHKNCPTCGQRWPD